MGPGRKSSGNLGANPIQQISVSWENNLMQTGIL